MYILFFFQAEDGIRDGHVTGVQTCALPISFHIAQGVTSVTLSAHKAGGPVGIGALWTDERERYPAIIFGGEQERGRRAGTENVLWIDLMGQLANHQDHWPDMGPLRDRLASRSEEHTSELQSRGHLV